jgi:alpha-mannosidase
MNRPVWYTFGNHFHWVDMQWLWGYGVLGASIRDMLAFTAATGARGNLNFDAVGYERMAAEEPDALAELRTAVADRTVEIVGASYGQPYPLFHHGESAVRQLTYGVRAVSRLLGVRPRSYWEEEFSFYPQLPQLLADVGYRYASLFFQWTWHTPHVPSEDAPAIWWEGLDGTRILTTPRGPLNLHQWPEDFAALRSHPLLANSPAPVIQQWLELLPSPDWMCRSELLLDGMKELLSTPGLDIRFGTLSEVLEAVGKHAEVRRYTMDDVFHGMSLGKNGDLGHRRSRETEQTLLAAEALSVLAGRLGRPYPHWDVYPVWELEEGWRELLAFQHHDNDECEGLCGHVGYAGLDRGHALARAVLDRTVARIADRTSGPAGRTVLVNPLGWARSVVLAGKRVEVPALGWTVLTDTEPAAPAEAAEPAVTVTADADTVTLLRGDFRVVVDRHAGVVTTIGGLGCGPAGLGGLRCERDGVEHRYVPTAVHVDGELVVVSLGSPAGDEIRLTVALAPELDAVDLSFDTDSLAPPDGRHHASLMTLVEPDLDVRTVLHDTPYAVTPVVGRGRYPRKYPTGEWMTSPQVFEEVVDPFTGLQLVDLLDADGAGLLWLHDGSQGFLRAERGAWNVLSMRDPWDEENFTPALHARVRVLPHTGLDSADRWRLAQEFTRPVLVVSPDRPGGDLPAELSLVRLDGLPGAAVTAAYRETGYAGTGLPEHASGRLDRPVLVRLVEFDGADGTADLVVTATVAGAWRASALGELREPLPVRAGDGVSRVSVALSPYQVTTVVLDLVEAGKQSRDLDAHREVWATVHRIEEES